MLLNSHVLSVPLASECIFIQIRVLEVNYPLADNHVLHECFALSLSYHLDPKVQILLCFIME